MKLVVDSNILFSFFWKHSFLNTVMPSKELELYSPEFALKEISKYKKEIMKKTKLEKKEFESKREELALFIEFVPLEKYKNFFSKLKNVPDKDDIDFLALALKLECSLWSNDKALKKQGKVKVLETSEILTELAK
ncbi:hypothetical protein KKB11_00115 [Candidatus Micrarchaeota archaeon]|nr:hypothetical protein [Candidatus Micrarchaeota archaeon]